MPQHTEYHEAHGIPVSVTKYEPHGIPVSVTKYEPDYWELAEVQEYEKRDNEMRTNLAIALNSALSAKFQIENINNPKTPYEMRVKLINRFLDNTIKSIQEVQGLYDIE